MGTVCRSVAAGQRAVSATAAPGLLRPDLQTRRVAHTATRSKLRQIIEILQVLNIHERTNNSACKACLPSLAGRWWHHSILFAQWFVQEPNCGERQRDLAGRGSTNSSPGMINIIIIISIIILLIKIIKITSLISIVIIDNYVSYNTGC